ncbi:hypothetical protein SAMN04488023_101322 [Pedobacter rhizosphaerae]|uniref:Uncharacterized protein n=1 Tax=Pedobacter rhizosphaerae TaxID=390241 RepID=A0A1H9JED5_9SPHI|nr:hypothetical protein SAMN04488023_101322 [Pedobacter rhizosphaerae]
MVSHGPWTQTKSPVEQDVQQDFLSKYYLYYLPAAFCMGLVPTDWPLTAPPDLALKA